MPTIDVYAPPPAPATSPDLVGNVEASAKQILRFQKEGIMSPATRNRTRDHLIAAAFYSQMLYQLSYSRLEEELARPPIWSSMHACPGHAHRPHTSGIAPTGCGVIPAARVRVCARAVPFHPMRAFTCTPHITRVRSRAHRHVCADPLRPPGIEPGTI